MTWSSEADELVTDNVHMIDDGCYICQPDNPAAAEDGCSDCELSWEMYVEALEDRDIPRVTEAERAEAQRVREEVSKQTGT